MKAIITTYHGPTDTRGSRIVAREPDGKRISFPYDHALTSEANHREAAKALCVKLNWPGEYVMAWTATGYVHCDVYGQRWAVTTTDNA